MTRYRFEIGGTWDGGPLLPGEQARIDLTFGEPVRIEIEATAHGDPPPPSPAGRCDGLWNHEVVELFLLGRGARYLELEFGPHGHWLALRLEGRRHLVSSDLALDYAASWQGDRWTARASFSSTLLPPEPTAANAYAIHGPAAARRHLAWQPVPGEQPDFHRLQHFAPLARALRSESDAS